MDPPPWGQAEGPPRASSQNPGSVGGDPTRSHAGCVAPRSPLSQDFRPSGKWTEELPGGERTGSFARPGEEGPVQEEGGTGKLTESWGLQPQIPGASVAPLSLPRVWGATGQGSIWPEELSLARPGHGVRAPPPRGLTPVSQLLSHVWEAQEPELVSDKRQPLLPSQHLAAAAPSRVAQGQPATASAFSSTHPM